MTVTLPPSGAPGGGARRRSSRRGNRRRRSPEPLLPPRGLIAALVVSAASLAVLVIVRPGRPGTSGSVRTPAPPASRPAPLAPTSTTAPPPVTDPGELPQTDARPDASTPANQARAKLLFDAIVADDPAAARAAFLPRSAYLQIKALRDPGVDYDNRLLAQFAADIHALHAKVAPAGAPVPTFQRLTVTRTPVWVTPGMEYNKGSYWRVYDSAIAYGTGGRTQTITVKSMISWRGEWYVVHLVAIR